jgi:hypothetical protein
MNYNPSMLDRSYTHLSQFTDFGSYIPGCILRLHFDRLYRSIAILPSPGSV